MPIGRREFIVAGAAVPLSVGSTALVTRAWGRGEVGAPYRSTLINGLTPERVQWDDQSWHAAMGSTWTPNMEHSLQLTATRARFEIRDSANDRGPNDPNSKRRSELHATKSLLPNGIPLWGAMSFNHHSWADPSGMARQWGGVHGQIHMHKFGGSPAVAFRRKGDGRFLISTRGENDLDGHTRWIGPLAFNTVHDLVYRVVLHPSQGELDVWVDGRQIINVRQASIGSSLGGCYWCLGCYYSGGIACPIIAEFANHVHPLATNLSGRTTARPRWPAQ